MSVPRTRSTKDKPGGQESAQKTRWKSLTVSGEDPGEIYGHTLTYDSGSESIFCFGGSSRIGSFHNSVHRFDLRTQKWNVVETYGKSPKGRHFHSAVLLDHNMYIFGGKCNGYMNDIAYLNLVTMEWTEVEKSDGNIPSRRYGHSMVVYNRNFYIYGGYDDFGYKCNDLYEYRPTLNSWKKILTQGEAPERYHHSAVVHEGSMYLFGGSVTDTTTATCLYEYRFGTMTWTRIPTQNKAPEGRWGHSSFVHDNHLYILGGCDNILCFKDVYRISLDSFAWKKVKKVSGFDPRYFGGCIVFQSHWSSPQSSDGLSSPFSSSSGDLHGSDSASTVRITDPEFFSPTSSSSSSSSSSPKPSSSPSTTTVLHHSQIMVATGSRGTTRPVAHPQVVSAIGVVPRPLIGADHAIAAPSTSSSSTSQTTSSSTPPLPAVVSASPLPLSPSIGLGWKVFYHGGRNIHNWAFGDVLVLTLEGENSFNPFQMEMTSLVGSGIHSDVTFFFPNEPGVPTIPAHKAILAIRCEPFSKMFSMGMMESNSGQIEIVDVPSPLFRVFLIFLYTGSLPALDALHDNLNMLKLADKYFLGHLKSICENRLKTFISSSSLALMWETAQVSHASSLQRSIVRFVTRYSDALMTSEGKKSLPKSLLIEAKAKLSQLSATSSS